MAACLVLIHNFGLAVLCCSRNMHIMLLRHMVKIGIACLLIGFGCDSISLTESYNGLMVSVL